MRPVRARELPAAEGARERGIRIAAGGMGRVVSVMGGARPPLSHRTCPMGERERRGRVRRRRRLGADRGCRGWEDYRTHPSREREGRDASPGEGRDASPGEGRDASPGERRDVSHPRLPPLMRTCLPSLRPLSPPGQQPSPSHFALGRGARQQVEAGRYHPAHGAYAPSNHVHIQAGR